MHCHAPRWVGFLFVLTSLVATVCSMPAHADFFGFTSLTAKDCSALGPLQDCGSLGRAVDHTNRSDGGYGESVTWDATFSFNHGNRGTAFGSTERRFPPARNQLYCPVGGYCEYTLPAIRAKTYAGPNYRLNSNNAVAQAYYFQKIHPESAMFVATLDYRSSGADGGATEDQNEGNVNVQVFILDYGIYWPKVNNASGIQSTLFSVSGLDCGAPGVLAVGFFNSRGDSPAAVGRTIPIKPCNNAREVQLQPNQHFVFAATMQSPSNRGGYADAGNTLTMGFDPDLPAETLASLQLGLRDVVPYPSTGSVAIEFYHAGFDHYFVTSIPDEVAKLDGGIFAGWVRTGKTFNVGSPGTQDVCRFFSTAFGERSSHFYTASASECATVKRSKDWQFEGNVFTTTLPDGNGDCPAQTAPVYRLYNNGRGGAPNHRLTTDFDARAEMIAKGWIVEGNGPVGGTMCAPL